MSQTFHLPDMGCNHCVATIREALATGLPGANVEIDLPAKTVTVEGDAARAGAILTAAGYPPDPAG